MLTAEQKALYKKNGFLILKNVFGPALVSKMHIEIHTAVKQQLLFLNQSTESSSSIDNIFKDLQKLHSLDLPRYLSTLRMCSKLTSIYEAILHPRLLEACSSLGISIPIFQTQPVFHVMSDKLMIKDGYFGIGAHQDWPALQSGLDTFTTWAPLVPVKEGKYTLQIIPGSHLLGFCESVETANIHEIPAHIYQNYNFMNVELQPGDVLIFSVFLIHRSEMEGEPGAFRMAYSMRYENACNENFIRRNYPGAQKRVVERSLDPQDIPTKDEVIKTFN